MQYLTIENITTLFTVFLVLETAVRKVWPDNKYSASIERGKAWVRQYAPVVVALTEELAKTGVIPKASKALEYMHKLDLEWFKAHPDQPTMPATVRAEAMLIGEAAKVTMPHVGPDDPAQ